MSDFSLGGSLGYQDQPIAGTTNHNNNMFLEPGFQIRVFLASNVALSFSGGIMIGVVDASDVAITGQGVSADAGVHYYFF